jgi:hypothetical protein
VFPSFVTSLYHLKGGGVEHKHTIKGSFAKINRNSCGGIAKIDIIFLRWQHDCIIFFDFLRFTNNKKLIKVLKS